MNTPPLDHPAWRAVSNLPKDGMMIYSMDQFGQIWLAKYQTANEDIFIRLALRWMPETAYRGHNEDKDIIHRRLDNGTN